MVSSDPSHRSEEKKRQEGKARRDALLVNNKMTSGTTTTHTCISLSTTAGDKNLYISHEGAWRAHHVEIPLRGQFDLILEHG